MNSLSVLTGLSVSVVHTCCRWRQVTTTLQGTQHQDVQNVPVRLL